MKRGKLIIVSGGARSGKSTFAEALVEKMDRPIAYLATSQALDPEMEERIRIHAARRPPEWTTIEEPVDVSLPLKTHGQTYKTWLLDCITLYVSNLLLQYTYGLEVDSAAASDAEKKILEQIEILLETIQKLPITMVAVTNEVGWGLVPGDPLSRAYRDIAGRVNQRLAQAAEEVYLVALGLPIRLKP